MRLDETNTSVKLSDPYLDYSLSYCQKSVYVAVIDDGKYCQHRQKSINNISSESLIQALHFDTSGFL